MRQSTSFGLVFLIWFAGLGAAAQYGKISVIYDQLPAIYPHAGPLLGFFVSLVGFVGILFGVVAGLLVARVGFRVALIWALWAGAVLSLMQSVLPPLPIMLALRALEGASHLAIVVAAPTLIAHLSASRHLGLTLTLWGTFFGVAYTGLVWIGLPLVAAFGLPVLFQTHAIWMAALALILSSALREVQAGERGEPLSVALILRRHLTIYRSPTIAAPAIGWLFYTLCFLSLLTLIPPYLPQDLRAVVLGAIPLVSILSSMTLGVFLLRYLSGVNVVVLGFGLCVLCLIWLVFAPGAPLACLALSAALGLVQGASFAAVPQLNDTAEARAQSNGAMAQMGNIGNTLGTPVFAAILVGAGYSGMIVAAASVLLMGAMAHIWLARQRRS